MNVLLPSCTDCVVLRELDVSVACAHVFVAIEADFIVVLRRPQSLVPNYVLHSQPKLYRWKRERERGGVETEQVVGDSSVAQSFSLRHRYFNMEKETYYSPSLSLSLSRRCVASATLHCCYWKMSSFLCFAIHRQTRLALRLTICYV